MSFTKEYIQFKDADPMTNAKQQKPVSTESAVLHALVEPTQFAKFCITRLCATVHQDTLETPFPDVNLLAILAIRTHAD